MCVGGGWVKGPPTLDYTDFTFTVAQELKLQSNAIKQLEKSLFSPVLLSMNSFYTAAYAELSAMQIFMNLFCWGL